MKPSLLLKFSAFGLSTIMFRRKKVIWGTIILTDKCNLSCKHCAVNNITATIYPYEQIQGEMQSLYKMGVRILFFCGGETFLWSDGGKNLRDLVVEAKRMGFLLVNVVTNGTFPLNLPEADLILLSLDGGRDTHASIRGETYDEILKNIRGATSDKKECCRVIEILTKRGYPIFNLTSAFPYLVNNDFKTPCFQCVVMENGNLRVIGDMLRTYLKYI